MLFSALIIILVAIVAYFHYVQGLFSATISAVCAAIAAIVAVSYHETVIAMLFKGAVANQAEAMVLCALFALVYFILRIIVDKTIPGNVRYPLMVDKIGAAVVGVIAGLFATGVLALAAGSLPLGLSIAGYARYPVSDRPVTNVSIPGQRGGNVDVNTYDEIRDTDLHAAKTGLDPNKRSGLLLPVDDILAGVVGQLSTGALSNDRPLYAVHPDWPTELYGQRAGIQVGTKHVLLNLPSLQMVSLKTGKDGDGVYKLDQVPELDSELKGMREVPLLPEKGDTLKPAPDQMLLIVRVTIDQNATDEDGKARLSPMSTRLVGWTEKGGAKEFADYYPIGTLEGASTLLRNKPDDSIIVNGGKSVDFVYLVPRDAVLTDANPKAKDQTIKDGVFVEVKRMARLDLSGKVVKGPPPFDKDVEVLRKDIKAFESIPHGSSAGGGGGGESGAVETSAGPIEVSSIKVDDKLFSAVNPGAYNGDTNVSFQSGTATMKNKKFAKLKVDPTDTLARLKMGDFPVTDLYVPDGKKMVQAIGKTPAKGDSWGWTNLNDFALVDATGNKYKPYGVAARVKVEGADRMEADYDSDNPVPSVGSGDGRAYDVYLMFNVPDGTKIKQLNYQDKPIKTANVTVP